MEITDKNVDGRVLKVKASSNEESLFTLLKTYLHGREDVDVAGTYKGHHLVDETEFYLRVPEGKEAENVFKEALNDIKKDLESKKVK